MHVLQLMGLPESALQDAKRAFQSDAQAGTAFARDDSRGNVVPLPADMQETVRQILSAQPVITAPDFVLDGTLAANLYMTGET